MSISYYQIIKHPVSTEKTVRLMEKDNKLVFAVARQSSKQEIKKALEEHLKIKIVKINTLTTSKGIKRAFVKLSKETQAIDIATQLGMM
ncbi:MAG TPA: 50S ribosomal protein L23 [Candidatus Nanoarchaeia archaeon]|nr:50S ribosomal protein L23 [Candidatus Nanoarchaeia archaeon]